MFSAPNESTNTVRTINLAETASPVEPFDVCELSPIQQLFLCDQAAKYKDLSFRLNFFRYTYEKCEAAFTEWLKFLCFRCPPLIITSEEDNSVQSAGIIIYWSGTQEPAKALQFSFYPNGNDRVFVPAWMKSTDLDILKEVDEAPGTFGFGSAAAMILESSEWKEATKIFRILRPRICF